MQKAERVGAIAAKPTGTGLSSAGPVLAAAPPVGTIAPPRPKSPASSPAEDQARRALADFEARPDASPRPFLDPDAGSFMSPVSAAQLTLDLVGIVDPTPVSDGLSAALSLGQGDLVGAGASVVSMLPGAGDLAAKPLALAKTISKAYPWAERLEPESLMKTLSAVKETHSLTDIPSALRSLNNLQGAAESAYQKAPRAKEEVRKLELPTEGPFVFAPPEGFDPKSSAARGARGGVLDAFGNEWVTPRSGAEHPSFAVYLAKKSGLSSFSAAGRPVYIDTRGEIAAASDPSALGHTNPGLKVPAQRLKA